MNPFFIFIMFKENWNPIHYFIVIFAVFLLCMIAQHGVYVKQIQDVNKKYEQPETEHQQEFNYECIDVNAYIINGDTIANENI